MLGSESKAADYPPFKVGLSTQVVAAGFELIPKVPGDKNNKLTFRPAQSNYVGLILGYKWIAGTLAFSVPASSKVRDVEGVSNYQDYRLSYYLKKFGFEAVYNRFKGYVLENSSVLSAESLGGAPLYRLPDLESMGYGFNLIFTGDPKSYSLSAAIDQSEIQKKSGGSTVILVSSRFQNIQNGVPFVPVEKRPDFGLDQNVSAFRSMNVSGSWGYAYNWVPGNFYLSGLGALGPGYQTTRYDINGVESRKSSTVLNLHIRLGLGWNSKRAFFTTNVGFDRIGFGTESVEVGGLFSIGTIAAGVRF
ncbi:MAG TPA: hypothetical protein DCS07_14060 [Bdellovibrionales bacterium]|nr:MAG: hypothetical protein A2Z97_08305 [Bdellovibrionales bacterium GWB1_52_6]OFZ03004.1 MAG: hypothetical protein A2X97_12150 [Bdellovibrionales bacterium GWA1_52_35]OFZ36379.1 MAG: hypothetical protein A2070_13885 [Bdellovibrionales bacterium GWC1_52_8]HAR43735.1 hypothetical protein [Bdellovibrionales bacterium]HCM38812.1 hypothetical protein [Bdellovibrionales bacterium]